MEELVKERRSLLQLCEDLEKQVKDGHRSLEDALDKIGQMESELSNKVKEMEEIRKRITEVAILFEKKEIKQKYSFEVLCDFIYDKAQRLFQKYESVSKENKVMNEEKNFYFQRRLEQLEAENDAMKETIIQINIIVKEFVPRLSSLTGVSIKGERVSIETTGGAGFEYVKQVLEKVEEEFRINKKENTHLKDRLQELLKQLEIYKNEVASNKEYERRKLEVKEDQLKKEVDTVKRDKDKMCER